MIKESKVLAVWMTIWSASAMAQTDIAIELPQQPLSKALSALARQSGTDIIAPSGLMADRTAPALKGRMTVREALGRLLRGTALDVEQRDGKTYVVILPKSTVSRPDTSSGTTTVLPPIVVRNQADSDTQGFVAESTTSATRTNAALIEVPQSIQVVNQKVIQSQQAQSVADALRNVSGVVIQDKAANFNAGGEANINGFPANVTLNGGLVGGNGSQNLEMILPMAAISRVEVLKGADAIISGNGEPGGTVNIVTKIPETTPLRELTVETGSYGHLLSSIDLTGPVTSDKRLSYRFIVSGERSAKSFGGFDGKRDFYVSPSLRWKDGGTDLIVEVDQHSLHSPYAAYGVVTSAGVYPQSHNQTAYTGDNVTGAQYDWKQEVGRYLSFHSSARYEASSYGGTPVVSLQSLLGNNMGVYNWGSPGNMNTHFLTLDNNINLHLTTGAIKQELMAGYAYRLETRSSNSQAVWGMRVAPFPTDVLAPLWLKGLRYPPSKNSYKNLYFQDKVSWKGLHILISMAHGQWWDSRGSGRSYSKWNPNIGVAYQISDNWAIFANEQHTFRPNPDLFLANGKPAPPTVGQSIEAGVKFMLFDNRLSGTVAVYRSRLQNKVVRDGTGRRVYFAVIPVGQTTRGISIDMSGEIIRGLNLIASYSYNNYSMSEQEVARGLGGVAIARHHGSIWATYDFQSAVLHGWGVGAGILARTAYQTTTITGEDISMPGQVSTDGSIYYRGKRWSATFGIKNIFNRRLYGESGGGEFVDIEPGRAFLLTGTFQF